MRCEKFEQRLVESIGFGNIGDVSRIGDRGKFAHRRGFGKQ